MISREDAVALAESNFPKGPEALAAKLNVVVEVSALSGCDGWCVRLGTAAIIRINSTASISRQRFTLAHELAHLILGTKPDVASNPFQSDSREEREADALSAEFLIPAVKAREFVVNKLPVDARTLRRLAKAANVSPIMAACRIVNMADILGLMNAAVVFFDKSGEYQWRYSNGLRFSDAEAEALLKQTVATAPELVRAPNSDGNTVVASAIRADRYTAVFLQLLPTDVASRPTNEERTRELREQVFENDYSFQQSVAACVGIIRRQTKVDSLDRAIALFYERYLTPGKKWTSSQRQKLLSDAGREFLGLELGKTFRRD